VSSTLPPAFDLDGLLRRLHLPTVRRLYADLAQRAEGDGMAYRDSLAVLMAEEVAHRAQTRIQRCTRRARFPFLKTIDEYDFTFQSAVRLSLLGSALGPEFVTQGHSLIFSGPSGTGKTHLAVAIAYRAIQNGFDAFFTTATDLIDQLSTAARRGRLRHVLPLYTHPAVLVIDEVGYLSYGPDAANVLFQVVNDRHLHRRPLIFTTNKPLAVWGRVLHDPDLAEAILDRTLERGRHIELRGRSYRTRHAPLDLTPASESRSPEAARISGEHRPEFPEPTPRAIAALRTCERPHRIPRRLMVGVVAGIGGRRVIRGIDPRMLLRYTLALGLDHCRQGVAEIAPRRIGRGTVDSNDRPTGVTEPGQGLVVRTGVAGSIWIAVGEPHEVDSGVGAGIALHGMAVEVIHMDCKRLCRERCSDRGNRTLLARFPPRGSLANSCFARHNIRADGSA
jgi:DNA replication protein DnaC